MKRQAKLELKPTKPSTQHSALSFVYLAFCGLVAKDSEMAFPRSRGLLAAILAGVLGLIVWPGFAGFYSSLLWYQQLGYGGVFTTSITTKFWLGLVAGLIAGIILFINLKFAMRLAPNVPAPVGYFEIEGEKVPAPNIARIVTKFAVPIAFIVGLLLDRKSVV